MYLDALQIQQREVAAKSPLLLAQHGGDLDSARIMVGAALVQLDLADQSTALRWSAHPRGRVFEGLLLECVVMDCKCFLSSVG